ncbi:MAG: shikimate kinase [Bifidobacteriaceae bacterium]|nr:shikimate kinase [Bifidobacteriaceae bacterium]
MNGYVLIGPPGSGKTSVGQALAEQLGLPFWDTDQLVSKTAGQSVADIFTHHGEAHFRMLERQAVIDALEQQASRGGVVALGGGAPIDGDTGADLQTARRQGLTVVFLDISAAVAAKRVGLDASRPLLAGSPRRIWRELMDQRRPVYEGLANLTVLVDGLEPQQIAAQIATATSPSKEMVK